jgi:plastocyanin
MGPLSKKTCTTLATLAVAVGTTLPAIAFGGARTASNHTVTLKNVRFHPGTLMINRGDTVTWLWRDREEHNITFHGLHSRTMTHGSYAVRFTRSGSFSYRCTIHASEGMRGKIVVH